jgi:hypothetical protein
VILKINLILISFIFIDLSFAQEKIEEVFKSKSEIEDPMSLRDPFLGPKLGKRRTKRRGNIGGKTNYSNIPQIGQIKIDDLVVIGVIIGPERRAFVKTMQSGQPSKDTYVVKEGMRLGENRAELKAILPGGLVFVEKNTNIYGEDEYLETVVPISK